MTRLFLVPATLQEANLLVDRWHRHHQPINTARFCIAVVDEDGQPHGAAIVGTPAARLMGDPQRICEVRRLVTDGVKNGCSMLYAATARAAEAMGYERIQTYILDSEPGVSLRASGWTDEGEAGGGEWFRPNNPTHAKPSHQSAIKRRWAKTLNGPRPLLDLPKPDESGSLSLWDGEEPAA